MCTGTSTGTGTDTDTDTDTCCRNIVAVPVTMVAVPATIVAVPATIVAQAQDTRHTLSFSLSLSLARTPSYARALSLWHTHVYEKENDNTPRRNPSKIIHISTNKKKKNLEVVSSRTVVTCVNFAKKNQKKNHNAHHSSLIKNSKIRVFCVVRTRSKRIWFSVNYAQNKRGKKKWKHTSGWPHQKKTLLASCTQDPRGCNWFYRALLQKRPIIRLWDMILWGSLHKSPIIRLWDMKNRLEWRRAHRIQKNVIFSKLRIKKMGQSIVGGTNEKAS